MYTDFSSYTRNWPILQKCRANPKSPLKVKWKNIKLNEEKIKILNFKLDLYRDGGFNNDNDILKQSPFFYSFIAEDHSTANEEP